jgi:hypothetical protein
VSLTPVANGKNLPSEFFYYFFWTPLPPASLTPVANFRRYQQHKGNWWNKFATGVVDIGGKFAPGVVDTRGKFAVGVVVTGGAP